MLDFSGQKVLITGASGGIGKAIATLFAKQSATVGLCGRNKDKLEKISAELNSIAKSSIFECDLNNITQVKNLFDKADEEMNGIDILICNAGVTKDSLAMRMSLDDFEDDSDYNQKNSTISEENTEASYSNPGDEQDWEWEYVDDNNANDEDWEWEYVEDDGNGGDDSEDWEWEYVEDNETPDNNNNK